MNRIFSNSWVSIDLYEISRMTVINNNVQCDKPYSIRIFFKNGTDTSWSWNNESERNDMYKELAAAYSEAKQEAKLDRPILENKTTNNNIMNSITDGLKSFVNENKNTLYWIAVVFLIDHFFLGGALRDKLKGTCEGLLNKVNNGISNEPASTTATK